MIGPISDSGSEITAAVIDNLASTKLNVILVLNLDILNNSIGSIPGNSYSRGPNEITRYQSCESNQG